jgi:hypothetical protein
MNIVTPAIFQGSVNVGALPSKYSVFILENVLHNGVKANYAITIRFAFDSERFVWLLEVSSLAS